MYMLRVVELACIAILLFYVVTQIVIPLVKRTPLFPLFRMSEVKQKAEETREEVEHMREYVDDLQELGSLTKQKKSLEEQIAANQAPEHTK